MIFNDKVYNVLKWVATVCLPALASLTLVIGQIWSFTDITVPVGATIAAVATFLGALLGISSMQYAKVKGGESDVENK